MRDLADTCLVVLGGYPGPARRTIAVARDPAREPALVAEPVLEGRPGDPLAEVLRTGEPRVDGTRVVVPLRARGRALGALAADLDGLDPAARVEALALLEELGRRAALALDNARLYAERSAIATTLQRSLLPPDLPRIPGAQIAARYLASGDGIEIGGDFYDCFATGGDDWALVIGDVCGKGAEAAAVTALARYTLRASVLHSRRPAQVLAELNEALLRQGLDYRFCTVLYASVTPRPDGCDVVLATGGHPLPLVLRADGAVETAGAPGTLLGIVREPEISEERVALRHRRRARPLHGRRRRGQPVRRGARARAARGAAAHLRGERRGRDRRGRRGARRWPCRTGGCATTWRSSCSAWSRLASLGQG